MPRSILPGKPYPQGAVWDGTGVNFSLYSEKASGVELGLFDDVDSPECEASGAAGQPPIVAAAQRP